MPLTEVVSYIWNAAGFSCDSLHSSLEYSNLLFFSNLHTLKSTLCAIKLCEFWWCMMSCIDHFIIILDSFTTLKIPCVSAVQSSPPFPQKIYTFNAIGIKIPMTFFAEIEKSTLKFIWNLKGPQKGKKFLQKEEQCCTSNISCLSSGAKVWTFLPTASWYRSH